MFIDSLGLEAFREDGILGFGSTMLRLPAGEITLADYSADFSRMLVKDVLFMSTTFPTLLNYTQKNSQT